MRTKNTFLEQKLKMLTKPETIEFSMQTENNEKNIKILSPINQYKNLDTEKDKELCLSSHINELTDDIEQLQYSLLTGNEPNQEIKDVEDLSPILNKNGVSTWSVNNSHAFIEKSASGNKENKGRVIEKRKSNLNSTEKKSIEGKLEKLQEEYMKLKAKNNEYQQNNSTYLEEIKILKEQLEAKNTELLLARNEKKMNTRQNSFDLEKDDKTLYSAISLKEITEHKHRINDLERKLEQDKEQIIQVENKCLKLKLEKEQYIIKMEKKSQLIEYLKTGIFP